VVSRVRIGCVVAGLAVFVAFLLSGAFAGASTLVPCGSIPYPGGGRVHIEKKGHVTCAKARSVAAALYAGKGRVTGGPAGFQLVTYYRAWVCYGDHVACHRKYPWAWIYGM
jgi:hypothetical protein